MNTKSYLFAIFLIFAVSSQQNTFAADLDRELLRKADLILAISKRAGLKNIGVLKFESERVVTGGLDKPISTEPVDGPFGISIAHRL